MSINLQQAFVALILLVPGFIVTSMQRGFKTKTFSSQSEWFVTSILQSIFLNLVTFAIASCFIDIYGYTIKDAEIKLRDINVINVYYYFILLYAFAVIWGIVSGKWQSLGFRAVANKLGITPYGEHSSVWDRLFDKQVPDDARAIWVTTIIDDGSEILGRLRHSSEIVVQDKPIELYITPYYVMENGAWKSPILINNGGVSNGIYLKLTDGRSVKFYFRHKDWTPNVDST